ncbi:MAG: hypothetical protein RL033_1695 [Pseudomonadota bacterium]|jgi:hypothetical protein
MNDEKRRERPQSENKAMPHFHGIAFGHPPHIAQGPFVQPGRFGRMFPNLPALALADEAIEQLATGMKEASPGPGQSEDPAFSHPTLPAGFTYLGQFIDHDITFDTTPMPERSVDPLQIHNFRTPALDLDSVYGAGPVAQPYLYQRGTPGLFLLGTAGASANTPGRPEQIPDLPNDLPRNAEGFALIGDPRNDENLVVAQTHVAFLKFHNKVMTTKNLSFEDTRRAVTWHYQWIVLHDFLTRVAGEKVVADVLNNGRHFYHVAKEPFIPVEFAIAAYRFGHTLVREKYDYNRVFGPPGPPRLFEATLGLLFNFTGLSGSVDGNGLKGIPSNWVIDWRAFHDVGPLPAGRSINHTRLFDPLLVSQLHELPNKGGSLAARNLQRGVRNQLPSGQSVANAMRLPVLTPEEIADGPAAKVDKRHRITHQTPLWFYILQEAKVKEKGLKLGPVGARLVTEVFVGLLEKDPNSFLAQNRRWTPDLGPKPGEFTFADLLRFVDDLNPIKD